MKLVLDIIKLVLDIIKLMLDIIKQVLDVIKLVLTVIRVVLDVIKSVLDVEKSVLKVWKSVLHIVKLVLTVIGNSFSFTNSNRKELNNVERSGTKTVAHFSWLIWWSTKQSSLRLILDSSPRHQEKNLVSSSLFF